MSQSITIHATCDRCGETADPIAVAGGDEGGEVTLRLPFLGEGWELVLGGEYCTACVEVTRTFLRQEGYLVAADEPAEVRPVQHVPVDVGRYEERNLAGFLPEQMIEQELLEVARSLSESEMQLVRSITQMTGHVPLIGFIERGGELKGTEVTYFYRPAGGGEETRTVCVDSGRPEEMAINALRRAMRGATQDHVSNPKG